MKSARTRFVLSAATVAAVILQAACASSRPTVVDPDASPGPTLSSKGQPARGIVVQADPIAHNVMVQMSDTAVTAVPDND